MPIFRRFPILIEAIFCLVFLRAKNNLSMTWLPPARTLSVLFQAQGIQNLLKVLKMASKTKAIKQILIKNPDI